MGTQLTGSTIYTLIIGGDACVYIVLQKKNNQDDAKNPT
jgi:hypothetical protein